MQGCRTQEARGGGPRSAPHSVAGPSSRTEKLPAEGQAPWRSTLAHERAGATSLTRASSAYPARRALASSPPAPSRLCNAIPAVHTRDGNRARGMPRWTAYGALALDAIAVPARHRMRQVFKQGRLLGSLCPRARPQAAAWAGAQGLLHTGLQGTGAPGAAPCDAKMRSRLWTPAARSARGALPGSGGGAPNCSPRKPCTRPARMRSPAARRRRAGSAASAPGAAGRTTVRCCPSHSSQNSWRRAFGRPLGAGRAARGARRSAPGAPHSCNTQGRHGQSPGGCYCHSSVSLRARCSRRGSGPGRPRLEHAARAVQRGGHRAQLRERDEVEVGGVGEVALRRPRRPRRAPPTPHPTKFVSAGSAHGCEQRSRKASDALHKLPREQLPTAKLAVLPTATLTLVFVRMPLVAPGVRPGAPAG